MCNQFQEPKPVHFIVDTGCTITTILSDNTTLLGLNCSGLKSASSVTTANGNVTPYILPGVLLIYETYSGFLNSKNTERYQITRNFCQPPTNSKLITQQKLANTFSLLGMDFLQKFKHWKFNDTHLILQT
jgi:predicted aspartyl protease